MNNQGKDFSFNLPVYEQTALPTDALAREQGHLESTLNEIKTCDL
jgi:hypothetical protein